MNATLSVSPLIQLLAQMNVKITGDDWDEFEEAWSKFQYVQSIEGDEAVLRLLPLFLSKRLINRWMEISTDPVEAAKLATLADVKKVLSEEIFGKPNHLVAYDEFIKSKQSPNQSVLQYYHHLLKLLSYCDRPGSKEYYEDSLRFRFVDGLLPEIKNRVLQDGFPDTCAIALDRAQRSEAAEQALTVEPTVYSSYHPRGSLINQQISFSAVSREEADS